MLITLLYRGAMARETYMFGQLATVVIVMTHVQLMATLQVFTLLLLVLLMILVIQLGMMSNVRQRWW